MLSVRIELRGEELFCADTGEGSKSTVRRLTPDTLARLRGWAERYDAAVRSGALPPLLEIGREIAAFLDEGDRWLDQVLGGTGEIALDIAVPGRPEDRECILLDVPWELLAPNGIFLASDEAALRAAQIGFDLSVKGAMAFFGLPSQGSTSGYPADEATIEASEGVIADFMTDFAERSGAAAVHVIAHSMGNRGVLRAVNRIAAKAQRRAGKPFGQVILAAEMSMRMCSGN